MVDHLRGVISVPPTLRVHGHRRHSLLRERLETLTAGHHPVRPTFPAALVVSTINTTLSEQTFLELFIDANLSWDTHANHVVIKMTTHLFALKKSIYS